MLQALIAWSLRNVLIVLVTTAGITIAGVYALLHTPVDALPDLSDVQVIVYTDYSGQAPQVVEDQLTYPLSSALLSVPRARVVRGLSFFGASFVYVIFEDGTDIYWARSRVLEYLDTVKGKLPPGVAPTLGPDASGVGWVYQYALSGEQHDLGELRSLQDWYLRYQLAQTPNVAEIASVGGFVKQYQVSVDPQRLQAFDIGLDLAVNGVMKIESMFVMAARANQIANDPGIVFEKENTAGLRRPVRHLTKAFRRPFEMIKTAACDTRALRCVRSRSPVKDPARSG